MVSERVSAGNYGPRSHRSAATDELVETSPMILELLLLVTVWVLGLTAVHLVKPPRAARLEHPEPADGRFAQHADRSP